MIEVRIPKEITDYEEKFFFNMTFRQIISLVITCVITIPMYIYGKNIIPENYLNWIIIVIAAPIITAGFFKYNGLRFEKYLKIVLLFNFNDQKRIKDNGGDNDEMEFKKHN